MRAHIAVLPGDGIGPEVTAAAVEVLRDVAGHAGHLIDFSEHGIGGIAIDDTGDPLPQATIDGCLGSDAVLLGALVNAEAERQTAIDSTTGPSLPMGRRGAAMADMSVAAPDHSSAQEQASDARTARHAR